MDWKLAQAFGDERPELNSTHCSQHGRCLTVPSFRESSVIPASVWQLVDLLQRLERSSGDARLQGLTGELMHLFMTSDRGRQILDYSPGQPLNTPTPEARIPPVHASSVPFHYPNVHLRSSHVQPQLPYNEGHSEEFAWQQQTQGQGYGERMRQQSDPTERVNMVQVQAVLQAQTANQSSPDIAEQVKSLVALINSETSHSPEFLGGLTPNTPPSYQRTRVSHDYSVPQRSYSCPSIQSLLYPPAPGESTSKGAAVFPMPHTAQDGAGKREKVRRSNHAFLNSSDDVASASAPILTSNAAPIDHSTRPESRECRMVDDAALQEIWNELEDRHFSHQFSRQPTHQPSTEYAVSPGHKSGSSYLPQRRVSLPAPEVPYWAMNFSAPTSAGHGNKKTPRRRRDRRRKLVAHREAEGRRRKRMRQALDALKAWLESRPRLQGKALSNSLAILSTALDYLVYLRSEIDRISQKEAYLEMELLNWRRMRADRPPAA